MLILSRYKMFIVLLITAVILLIPGFSVDNNAPDDFNINLVKEFDGDINEAISPDGKSMFFADREKDGKTASLVEIGTWKTVKSFNFIDGIAGAYFFSDSQAILYFNYNSDMSMLDLHTGQHIIVERDDPISPYVKDIGFPVHDRRILMKSGRVKTQENGCQ